MRIGIFFGGPSREREVSFAGGRTVYDNLNKDLFTPVPIFVDSVGQFILLEWPYLYKGTIRDFYPPAHLLPEKHARFQHYIESFPDLAEEAAREIGRMIPADQLGEHIDFAFLALHGRYGEDGTLQAQLQNMGIPYSGSGVMACAIGMDKYAQKTLMSSSGFNMPQMMPVSRETWLKDPNKVVEQVESAFSGKIVIRPAKQGSSIGVSILDALAGEAVHQAINLAFFIGEMTGRDWQEKKPEERNRWINDLIDVKTGLGLPVELDGSIISTAAELIDLLDQIKPDESVQIKAIDSEKMVIVESFIEGREFSCIVIRDLQNQPLALPPTEIVKEGQLFDYRAKYLPGLSRKETPISLPDEAIEAIRRECEKLYVQLQFGCYARIDGFFTSDGKIILNDPNTTSGMLPSSFFFHQAAEIGLNPSQFLTYIIHASLFERIADDSILRDYHRWITYIEERLSSRKESNSKKKRVAVIFGGYSFERHISVESGRNIYEKLASSNEYVPVPVFLSGHEDGYDLFELPINLMLKDNADDIRDKILNFKVHPLIERIRKQAADITSQFAGEAIFEPAKLTFESIPELFDEVFIALHGRPGEDGDLQRRLEKLGVPYNGSNSDVSSITIHKFNTLQLLGSHQMPTTNQWVIERTDYIEDAERWLQSIEGRFGFPLIAKPVDDGCSSAVMKINDRPDLVNYLTALFRESTDLDRSLRSSLGLGWNEEFPNKSEVLIEALITDEGADLFMEITCGLMTEIRDGKMEMTIFEPSEALASGDILSLEEKFLAGQGLNITPARLYTAKYDYDYVSQRVKEDLKKAAMILGIEGYARIDAFVRVFSDGLVETIIIEVNSLPGMTPATCIYHQAAIEGLKPYEFIDKILTFAENRQQSLIS